MKITFCFFNIVMASSEHVYFVSFFFLIIVSFTGLTSLQVKLFISKRLTIKIQVVFRNLQGGFHGQCPNSGDLDFPVRTSCFTYRLPRPE